MLATHALLRVEETFSSRLNLLSHTLIEAVMKMTAIRGHLITAFSSPRSECSCAVLSYLENPDPYPRLTTHH